MASKMERAEKKLDEIVALLSAQELAEVSGGFANDVYLKAIDETRVEAAKAVHDQFLGTGDRGMYRGESADFCIVDLLTEEPTTDRDGKTVPPFITDPALRELGKDFAEDGVADVFRQGMKLALLLVGNLDYDI